MSDTTNSFIPYGKQRIEDDDIAAVEAVLRGDWLTTGPATEAFEASLAERVGARHALACSSGTAGLHMATLACGLGPGDAVIVPAITFLATANAVRMVGAEVVFSDVDPDTGLMTREYIETALAKVPSGLQARAVMPVHLAGQCESPHGISDYARSKGLKVIEDAAHAIGSQYTDNSGTTHEVGSCAHSDITVFSFHPVKTIAMGEGGAVTSNDDELIDQLTLVRNHGMTRNPDLFAHQEMAQDVEGDTNPWYYEMPLVGYNYRASDIHCALANSQLKKLDRFVKTRRDLASRYDRNFGNAGNLLRPLKRAEHCVPAWHLYPLLIDFTQLDMDRAGLMNALRTRSIGTQVHYIPVSSQPYYQDRYGDPNLPGAEAYYARTLSLPLHTSMSETDVDHISQTVLSLVSAAS
jgi:UDP-4-amino-4,6-dideoxy-N-acetyl-beta-L-altrosamine transaminase